MPLTQMFAFTSLTKDWRNPAPILREKSVQAVEQADGS
jgi:hypothetical protein